EGDEAALGTLVVLEQEQRPVERDLQTALTQRQLVELARGIGREPLLADPVLAQDRPPVVALALLAVVSGGLGGLLLFLVLVLAPVRLQLAVSDLERLDELLRQALGA